MCGMMEFDSCEESEKKRLLRVWPDLWVSSQKKEGQWQNDVPFLLYNLKTGNASLSLGIWSIAPWKTVSHSTVQSCRIYPVMYVTSPSACRSLPSARMSTNLWNMRSVFINPIFIVYLKRGSETHCDLLLALYSVQMRASLILKGAKIFPNPSTLEKLPNHFLLHH